MLGIPRGNRSLASALALLLAACGQEATSPGPHPPQASGTWVTHHIGRAGMPALILSGVDGGISWEVRALGDTLILRPDGTWEQRVRVRQSQNDGVTTDSRFWDHGVWTRSGDVIHFESAWIQNVSFRGELAATGELVVEHDFTLNGLALRRQMSR